MTADYRFENSLANSVGAAGELSAIGADAIGFIDEAVLGQTRPVLRFDRGSGLALTPASVVIDDPDAQHATEWQPATSRPGEIYTVEGQIAATGAFARGLKGRYRHASKSHRSTLRRGVVIVSLGAIVVLAAALIL